MRRGETLAMRRIVLLVFILALAGCGAAPAARPATATAPVPPTTAAATATASATTAPARATATAAAKGTAPATATATGAGATAPATATVSAPPPPTVLGPGFGQPDDVAVAPDGTIYFSDFSGGRIGRMPPAGGQPVTVAQGLADPEGIVVLPGGSLAVVEQARNEIVRVDPATGGVTPIAAIPNHTNLLGVDGIAWDAATQSLLVPDSPNGRLLEVDPRTGAIRVLVPSGLGRPTGAIVLPTGGFGIVDETGNRVLLDGPVAARPAEPDDIVAAGGRIYVNALSGGIWEVAPAVREVLRNLRNPQGLAAAPDGSLVIAEQGKNRLLRWRP